MIYQPNSGNNPKNYRFDVSDIYKNNIAIPRTFKSMSIDDARRDLRRYKGQMERSEYVGLMNIVHAERCKKLMLKIVKLNDEQLRQWLSEQLSKSKFLTTEIWEYITERLMPVDEAFLLQELTIVPSDETDVWVRSRKNEGYFFSDKVYHAALSKRTT